MGKMKSLWQDRLEEAEETYILRGDSRRFIKDVALLGISETEACNMMNLVIKELKS